MLGWDRGRGFLSKSEVTPRASSLDMRTTRCAVVPRVRARRMRATNKFYPAFLHRFGSAGGIRRGNAATGHAFRNLSFLIKQSENSGTQNDLCAG